MRKGAVAKFATAPETADKIPYRIAEAQAPSGNTFRMRGIVLCASPASEKFFPR